jgi:predicted metal-dependent hydrolase
MTASSTTEHFEEGIDLFNQGQFFECHEAWEQAWLRSSGAEKLFYQGLIQAAVAILHAQRGNLAGSRTLWAKASAKLSPLPAEHMGIALNELRQELERFFEAVWAGKGSAGCTPWIRRIGRQ